MVNTKTTLSKKVLAVVLAVACMIAFTPAIAFTQSAHADSATVNMTAGLDVGALSEGAIQNAISGNGATTSTASVSGKTVTMNINSAITGGQTITVPDTYSLVINAGTYNIAAKITTAGSGNVTINGSSTIAGTVTTGTTGTTAINGTTTIAPATGTAIDADDVTTGTVTVASGATVKAGEGTLDTAGASAITFPTGTTTAAGTLTVNGTVAGGNAKTATSGITADHAGGYAIEFSTSTTKALTYAKYTATGASLTGGLNVVEASGAGTQGTVHQTATNITDLNIKGSVSVTSQDGTKKVGSTFLATTNGVTSPKYQWYRDITTGTAKDVAISGATSSSYTAVKDDAGNSIYCVVTCDGLDGQLTSDSTAIDAMAAAPKFTTQPKSQTLNLGDTMTDLTAAATSASGTVTYKWYATTGTTAANGTEITDTNKATYNVKTAPTAGSLDLLDTAITSSTQLYNYYCVATATVGTDTASTTSDLATCTSTSFSIKTQPVSASYYQGDTLKALTVEVNGSVDTTDHWYLATKSDLSDGKVISTTTSTTLSALALSGAINSGDRTGTYYVYFKASKNSVDIQSAAATITIKTPTVKTQPKAATYAVGDTGVMPTVVLNGAPAGSTTTWYSNDVNSTKGGKVVTSVDTATAGTAYYYAVITYKDKSISTTVDQTLTTATAAITVEKLAYKSGPEDNIVLTGAPNANVLTIKSNGLGTKALTGLQWYYATTATGDGTVIASANAMTYTPTVGTAAGELDTSKVGATMYYYATYTEDGATKTTSRAKVTVADFAFTAQPEAATYAVNAKAKALSVATNVTSATMTYQWYVASAADGTGTAIVGATQAVYTPATSVAGDLYYYCVVTDGTAYKSDVAKVSVTPLAKNAKFTSGSLKYVVTTATVTGGNVHVYAPKSTKYKSVTVPATLTKDGATYKVTGINSKSFAKAKKLKTITIKSKTLTKSGVKNSLKGSKVTTVKVPKSKYKTYKKYFTKKNCGKTVKVKKY